MIAHDDNAFCRNAELYYYDFLEGHKPEDISEQLWQHMESCDHCKTEILLLKVAIDKADKDPEAMRANIVTTTRLELQFAYEGQSVGCDIVKPFMPLFLSPDFPIRTKTPITLHIESCPQCLADVESLQALDLDQKRLILLSQIMAEKEPSDKQICEKARIAIPAIAAMEFDDVSLSTLKHICICPDCRKLLFEVRQEIIGNQKSQKSPDEGFPCEAVTGKDLFDYCFPYDMDPSDDEYAKFRPSFISHVSSCQTCLTKMQKLHETVSNIDEREESGITTCFNLKDEPGIDTTSDPEGASSNRPIEGNVIDGQSEENWPAAESANAEIAAQVQKKRDTGSPASLNLRHLIKPLAAAAVILLVALLVLNGRKLKATDLSQVYENLAKVKNVYLKRISPPQNKVIQETWISRDLEIKMLKTKDQYVIWDIKERKRKAKYLESSAVEITNVDKKTIEKVVSTLVGPLEMLPFSKLSTFPESASWRRLPKDSLSQIAENMDIYEIIWTDTSMNGSLVYHRWHGFVESEKKLPVRTELYVKDRFNQEYELTNVIEIQYPKTYEIENLISELGF